MHRFPARTAHNSGNVLFLILLVVVLFAGLSYAVTQSMRGGGKNASSESAASQAADIENYAAILQQTIYRLILVNGCTPSQLSFVNTINNGDSNFPYTNSRSPSDKTCHVFDPAGGGLAYKTWPTSYLSDSDGVGELGYEAGYLPYKGHTVFLGAYQITDQGTNSADLVLAIPFLKKEICDELRSRFTGTTSYGRLSVDFNTSYFLGTADYWASPTIILYTNPGWLTIPYAVSCGARQVANGNRGGWTFYYTLLAR